MPTPIDDADAKRIADLQRAGALREQMLEADRARQLARKEAEEKRAAQATVDTLAEAKAVEERSEAKEEWRQGKHAQRRQEAEERRKAMLEAQRLAEEERKKRALEQQQKEYLEELHRRSVEKKNRERRDYALRQEELEQKAIADSSQRQTGEIRSTAESKEAHLESERKRRIMQATAQRDALLKRNDEDLAHQKQRAKDDRIAAERESKEMPSKAADARSIERQKLQELTRTHQKAADRIAAEWEEHCHRINAEIDRMVQEVTTDAQRRTQSIASTAEKKRAASTRRRQETEEWLGFVPEEKQKD